MSQRSAYTSEYIYCWSDYEVLRQKAKEEGNGKFLNFSTPAKWSNGLQEFEMPIIQGKIGAFSPGKEYEVLAGFLQGVETVTPISFLIFPEDHDSEMWPVRIQKLTKTPEGEVYVFVATAFEELY
jgi:hypothetical protein